VVYILVIVGNLINGLVIRNSAPDWAMCIIPGIGIVLLLVNAILLLSGNITVLSAITKKFVEYMNQHTRKKYCMTWGLLSLFWCVILGISIANIFIGNAAISWIVSLMSFALFIAFIVGAVQINKVNPQQLPPPQQQPQG